MIEKVKVELEIPKESKEVVDLIDAVLEKVMAKAPIAEFSVLIGDLMKAVEGVGQIDDEMKSDGRDEVAGYLVHKVLGRLMPAKVE